MIVKMQKATILCLEDDRSETLDALRDLGVLHLVPLSTPRGQELAQSRDRLKEARLTRATLDAYRKKPNGAAPAPGPETGDQVLEKVRTLVERRKTMAAELEALRREKLALEPYGPFDPATITGLAEKGITVRLFHVTGRKHPVFPDGAHVFVVRRDSRGQYVAIVSREDFEFAGTEFPLPERSLADVLAGLESTASAMQEIDRRLTVLSASTDAVDAVVGSLENDVAYIEAREGMGASTRIAYLQGFCPVHLAPALRETAAAHGWGIVIDDPAADDMVPTLIKSPAWVKPIKSLFHMLDILPGYHELDTRSAFMLFFALFFAILVGDAGYGIIFLALTLLLRAKFKTAPPEPFRLLTIVSICTIVWGAMTGNWFGIEPLPAPLRGVEVAWLKNDHNLMAFSFLVGAIHLTVAHAWKALKTINSTRALGELGWICMTWTMYFLARYLILQLALPSWLLGLFVAGLALLVVFMTPFKLLKSHWSDHVMLPFDVISNFSDLVSYVRLFAVGSAGLAVAVAFNELAVGKGVDTWQAAVKAALILLAGHGLNMILCLMSILVHGVRLNTLEFSSHVGLEWTGFKYTPFARYGSEVPE